MNTSFLHIELEVLAFVILLICFFFNLKLKEEKGFSVLKLMYIFSFGAVVFNILTLLPYEFVFQNQAPFLYYFCIGIVGFLWLLYCLEKFELEKLNKMRLVFLVPLLLALLIVIKYKVMQIFLCTFVFYAILALATSLLKRKKLSVGEKEERREIVLSILPALFLGALPQIFVPLGLMSMTLSVAVAFMVLITVTFRKKMITDELTGLANRYGMKEELDEQISEYKRDENDSFCVIACDMDEFKAINDKDGHDEGDRALEMVGKVLTKVADRHNAKAFRQGGDEFFIITDESEEKVAKKICEEVQTELENTFFSDKFNLKMSMGIKLYDGKVTVKELLKKADESLYDDKEARKAKKAN